MTELEHMEFIISSTIRDCEQKDCMRNCEFARQKDCKYFRAVRDLQTAGYGNVNALKAENESLIREADENAALAMQQKMRADDLEKENAELKARLEKAVELPVKVGDTVWLIGHIHGALACVDANITYVSMNEHFVRYTAQEGEWFHDFNDDYIGRYVFLTKQKAEAKLAELEEKINEETDKP